MQYPQDFEQLVNLMRELKRTGFMTVSPLARTRITAANIDLGDVFSAIENGDAFTCRETDRVKFITPELIVFVALGRDYDDEEKPHGFIVSAFKNRAPQN